MASAKAKRVDPAPRFLGSPPVFTLENASPNKKYVWVNQASSVESPGCREAYEIDGYEVEQFQPGGVKPRGIKFKQGDEIVVRGQWLMSTSRENYDAIVAEGQQRADDRERQIIKKKGLMDPARGGGNRYVRLSSSVSEIRQELGGASDG